MAQAITDPQVFELEMEDSSTGGTFIGRITGTLIAEDDNIEVYVTDGERVIVYDRFRLTYSDAANPEDELRDLLSPSVYFDAMQALGIKPVIDL